MAVLPKNDTETLGPHQGSQKNPAGPSQQILHFLNLFITLVQ